MCGIFAYCSFLQEKVSAVSFIVNVESVRMESVGGGLVAASWPNEGRNEAASCMV